MSRQATVRTGIDAHSNESRPNDNFSRLAHITLDGTVGSTRQAFLFFKLPFDLGATVLSATLRVRLKNAWAGGPHTVTVKRVTETWKEGKLTHNNRPAVTNTNSVAVAVTGGADGDIVEFNVAPMLQDAAGGSAFYGFRLELNTAGLKKLHSTETPDPDLQPELAVSWTRGPGQAIVVAPSGGRSVSIAQPRLQGRYQSLVPGEETLAEMQVQIASAASVQVDGSFTPGNVLHDSGWVATDKPEYDLATTIFNLADGDVRYWHWRPKDTNGRIGAWSDAAQFRRDTKAVAAITNPPAGPGSTVEETTPPLTHTFVGRVQKATEYTLFQSDGEGGWVRIWHRSRRATNALTFTLPAKLLRNEGADLYKLRLDIWDTIDREDMPGDRAYVRVERVFGYDRSGTPAAVTDLVATTSGAGVLLEFQRAAQPDYFALKVDGELVDDRIDSTDALVGAPNYEIKYYGLIPRHEALVEVEAVVLDAGKLKHSGANDEATVTPDPLGIWLIIPDEELEVLIADKQRPGMRIGESSEVHEAIDRRDAITLIDTIRGYEGRVSGLLIEYFGVAASTWRDRMERIRGWANRKEVRLIMFDYNFPVTISNVELPPETEDTYFVAFDYRQVGDFTFRSRV